MKKIIFAMILMTSSINFVPSAAMLFDFKEEHPLMEKENVALLKVVAERVSEEINTLFPNKKQIIVSLGQSPAYLCEMIKLIDKKQGRNNRSYLNVAFSGNFYSRKENGKEMIDPYLYQKYQSLAGHYITYLEKLGLSEDNLLDPHTQFILLEVCHTCQGLKSFLSFLNTFPRKPFPLYLQHNHFEPLGWTDSKRILLNSSENKLMVSLANADKFEDRLVPHFAYYEWEKLNPLAFKPEGNAPIIIEQLQQFIG